MAFESRTSCPRGVHVRNPFVSPGMGSAETLSARSAVFAEGICHVRKGILLLFQGKTVEVFFKHYLLRSEKGPAC